MDKDMLEKYQVYNLDMDNVEKDKVENIFLFFLAPLTAVLL